MSVTMTVALLQSLPPKTECACPSGGGIKNGHIRYLSYGGTQKERKTAAVKAKMVVDLTERDNDSSTAAVKAEVVE